MDRRTPGDPARLTAALARVPDQARWVDTRGMLLSGRAMVHARPEGDPSGEAFLVVVRDASLVGVVGDAAGLDLPSLVASLSGDVNVLAQNEDAASVAAA